MTAADTHAAISRRALFYSRSPFERIEELVNATDALAAQLESLRLMPTAEGAESIVHQLTGMQRFACNLVTALACGVEGGGDAPE